MTWTPRTLGERLAEEQEMERARSPVQAVADAIEHAETTAAPLAEVPFSLTPPVSKRGSVQTELF